VLAPLLPTVAGFVSFIWSLCASIFLRPFAPDGFPSFPATTDALTSAGRLFGPLWHEHRALSGEEVHCLSQQRFLPFCLQSCDVRVRDFLSSPFFFIPIRWLWPRSFIQIVSLQSMGSWAQGFACTWYARPSHPTESSSFRGPHGTPVLRTGISFPVALHGRVSSPQFLSITGWLTLA